MKETFSGKNLGEILASRAQEHPDRLVYTFLKDGEAQEENITYGELDARARAVAARLRENTQAGDRVLLVFPPGIDFVAGLYGCFYAGVVAVPIFPPQPGKLKQTLRQFENTARDAHSKFILCNQMVYSKRAFLVLMAKGLKGLQWLNISRLDPSEKNQAGIASSSPRELAVILYTSGSTGDPTGVMLSHQNAIENHRALVQQAAMGHVDLAQAKGFSWLPPYHVAGLFFGILLPVYAGGSVVLMSPLDFLAKPLRWLQGITRYRTILSGGPNFAFDYCVEQISPEERKGLDLSSWRFALNGSEAVRPSTLQRFIENFAPYGFSPNAFITTYGLTESGNTVSSRNPGQRPLMLHLSKQDLARHTVRPVSVGDEVPRTLVSNGALFDSCEALIVDPETHLPLAEDRVGEIWLKGPAIALGYWNKEQLTKRLFQARLAHTQEGPFLRTGDLGFLKEGELFVSGRLKEMIIIRGKNYYPQDMENSIAASHGALTPRKVAVFSVEADDEEQLVVVAECEKMRKDQYQEVMSAVRQALSRDFNLSPFAMALIKQGSLPRTSTLKVRRMKCRDLFLNGKLKVLMNWTREKRRHAAAPPEQRDLIILPRNDSEVEAFALKKLAALLEVDLLSLDLSRSLPSYGLDSLGAVELSHFLEKHLGVHVGIALLFESESIQAILEQVKIQWRKAKAEGPQILGKPDLLNESTLPANISFTNPSVNSSPRPLFLTGATGFLGAFLLEELLKKSDRDVYCLVRAAHAQEGMERIRKNLQYFSIWDPRYENRVVPVLGDLAKPHLGMGEAAFQELAGEIGAIYHCGANVNFIYSYWDLKPVNVDGTREIIRLAAAQKTKPLHYISTVGIFPIWGDSHGKTFREEDEPSLWEGHFSGYALSKWVAERLVQQAKDRGLPVTIYRVGEVIGHSETGACKPEKDAYSNMLKGALMLGKVPRLNVNIYFAPVDMVAKSVVFFSQKESSLGRTFHLFLDSMDGAGLVNLIKSQRHSLDLEEFPEFLEDMEELNQELPQNPLAPFMPLIRSPIILELSKKKTHLKLDSKKTLKELKRGAIRFPPVKQLVQTYFTYLERSGFLR